MSIYCLIRGKASTANDRNMCALLKANTVFIQCSYKPKQQVGWLKELTLFLIGESFTDEDQRSLNAAKMNPNHLSTCDLKQMNRARVHLANHFSRSLENVSGSRTTTEKKTHRLSLTTFRNLVVPCKCTGCYFIPFIPFISALLYPGKQKDSFCFVACVYKLALWKKLDCTTFINRMSCVVYCTEQARCCT